MPMIKKEFVWLKYYLIFVFIILSLYVYSMTIGYSVVSVGDSSHYKEPNVGGHHYFYQSGQLNHK